MAQMVKHLPAMWKTWVRSLGWEDPLEKKLATHSSILAWRTPWIEEPGGLQSMQLQRVEHNWATSFSLSFSFIMIIIPLTFVSSNFLIGHQSWEQGNISIFHYRVRSWHPVPSLHGNRWGNSGNGGWLYFFGLQNHCRWWLQPWN